MSICTETKRSEQKLDACQAFFGERHCRIITFITDIAGAQDGSYLDLNAIDQLYEESKNVLWISTDTDTGAPSIASDQTLIPVEFVVADTGIEIATKVETALNALTPKLFKVERIGAVLHIRNLFLGAVTVETFASAGDVTTSIGKLGFGGDLGAFASGGASMSTETIVEQIFADQSGEILLDEIIKGQTIAVEMTLAEMTQERWESLIGNISGSNVVINGNTLVGYGTGKLFQSKFQFAGMLVLHPISLALTDRSSDYVIHKTAPDMGSINFSGSEVQGGEFAFNAYQDKNINSAVDLFVKGDYTLL